jgi:hypothetical protein
MGDSPRLSRLAYFAMMPTIIPPITGDRNYPRAELVMSRADEVGGEVVIKENIGEQADQLVQHERDPTRDQPNPRREKRHQHHAELRRSRESVIAAF